MPPTGIPVGSVSPHSVPHALLRSSPFDSRQYTDDFWCEIFINGAGWAHFPRNGTTSAAFFRYVVFHHCCDIFVSLSSRDCVLKCLNIRVCLAEQTELIKQAIEDDKVTPPPPQPDLTEGELWVPRIVSVFYSFVKIIKYIFRINNTHANV